MAQKLDRHFLPAPEEIEPTPSAIDSVRDEVAELRHLVRLVTDEMSTLTECDAKFVEMIAALNADEEVPGGPQ